MARLSSLNHSQPDIDAINLRRALSRLEHKILFDENHRLQRSAFERAKTASNLEYTRTLLLRLERAAAQLKIQSRKQAQQATLIQQRALIKRLHDRLYALNNQVEDVDVDGGGDVDTFSLEILPSNPESFSAISLDHGKETEETRIPLAAVRNRHRTAESDIQTTVSTTGTDIRSALSPASLQPSSSSPPSSPLGINNGINNSSNDSISITNPSFSALLLDATTSDAANLTSLLVAQAAALKASSLAFGADLAADQEAVTRAAALLDKSGEGMHAATQRMGLLSRMSEGRWWWGRMVLYAGIAALWAVAILLVGVAPKLRF